MSDNLLFHNTSEHQTRTDQIKNLHPKHIVVTKKELDTQLLHRSDPTEKPDMAEGIIAIRKLHMRAAKELGFSCADEMLYPENHKYLDDLLGYVAVGARSVENQQHRLTASGLEIPVGMKNPTSGDLVRRVLR